MDPGSPDQYQPCPAAQTCGGRGRRLRGAEQVTEVITGLVVTFSEATELSTAVCPSRTLTQQQDQQDQVQSQSQVWAGGVCWFWSCYTHERWETVTSSQQSQHWSPLINNTIVASCCCSCCSSAVKQRLSTSLTPSFITSHWNSVKVLMSNFSSELIRFKWILNNQSIVINIFHYIIIIFHYISLVIQVNGTEQDWWTTNNSGMWAFSGRRRRGLTARRCYIFFSSVMKRLPGFYFLLTSDVRTS